MEVLNCSEDALKSEDNEFNEGATNLSDGDIKQHSIVNGFTNGYDKEKTDKEKHREKNHDKEREKEKHKDKDSEKHRSKDSDRDRHKEKHKDHKDRDKERHRDKDKDKEKEKVKDKDRDKERDKSKHSSSSSSKDKHSSSSSSKDKDKDRKDREKEKSKHHDDKERKDKDHKSSSSSRDKDKEHKNSSSSKHSSSKPSSNSTSKDKEHREKDKEKDRERDKEKARDKEKDKERSKEKHSSSSSKDKDRHSSEKHRSDKEKHSSSSSSKDKEKHSSEKKDKHKDKDKEKHREKEREKDIKVEKEEKKESLDSSNEMAINIPVKEEKKEFPLEENIKEESMDDDEEGKLMIKEEPTDDESKMDYTESSIDVSAVKKEEEDDDDDIPMAARMSKIESESEDDKPLSFRKKPKKEIKKKRKKQDSDFEDEEDEEDFKQPKKKKIKKEIENKRKSNVKQEVTSPKKKKKEEEEQEVWKWWEEEKKPDGVKWNFLEHKGPVFAPDYEPLPDNVKFYYDDKEMKLSEGAEEVATFYARMLDHDYTSKEAFNTNFMNDWRSVMTPKEQAVITKLRKCNFKHMHAYFIKKSEERKAMSKEEKKAIKEENEKITKEYGFCLIDGHKEKIGNFKIEPPGLFRGRGEHPKMGKLKRRVVSEDIIINCAKGSKVPPPPPGHKWKEVRHDNTVTWLASWTENVQGQVKYIMLNPSSKLKGEKDWQKYETARKLAKSIDKIRDDYIADWKSKEMRIRQRAVAMYFIDKLALRAGNEKDEDQADTVGCCSLRVEHISLHEEKDGKENVVVFDFLGKDSIRYYNEVPVEKRVFKNLTLFMENKKGEDDLFDRLNTQILNKHLSDLMDGLTAKVFRTYNASWTLQAQLKELTDPDSSIAEKLLSYNRANRAVAILCNHQRAVPKTHDKSMANLREKLATKREVVEEAEKNFKIAKREAKNGSAKGKIAADKAKKTLERLKEQLLKLELQETDKEENKTIALGTSKLNYLDPRISVAWCKKYDVPVDKIYNKTQRDKFRWAIDMATADYVF